MSAPIYDISGVEHRYGDRVVLKCERFIVPPAKIVGVRGPNGAGKSTLLSIMAFLMKPTAGIVRFMGQGAGAGDVHLRRRAVLMPQDPALLRRKVEANVLYGLALRGVEDPAAAPEALDLVGLDPDRYLRRWWWELSGGESHRVALAARLALKPDVLLLDEPTASLDPASAEMVRKALTAARDRRGLTVVAVSHDTEWLDSVSDELYRLDQSEGMRRIRS